MKITAGQKILLTGASGGLGTHLARAFASAGADLMLVAYPGVGLEDLQKETQALGVKSVALAADLRLPAQRQLVVERTIKEFGRIDILVNNAGLETTCAYQELSQQMLVDILNVNLETPMVLTHMVLPGMLERKSGYIVNMSSLAGKAGPAYQEPYAASKAGLINFTMALRATCKGTGVGATVICPGFVETGIYERMVKNTGCVAPALLGTSKPETVVRAVFRAVEKDLPEVIITKNPFRPLLAVMALFPRVGEWMIWKTGSHSFFGRVAEAQKKADAAQKR